MKLAGGLQLKKAAHTLFWLCVGLFALGSPAKPVAAQVNQATLIVDYGAGVTQQYCVTFSESSITGYELLRRASLNVKVDQFGGLGAGVCMIGDTGCNTPSESCFCKSVGADGRHWSYFHGDGAGGWKSSSVGASSYQVRDGAVEAWVWTDSGAPSVSSAVSACAVAQPATATPSATPTTAPPTATTLPPTKTAVPPTPIPPTRTPAPPTRTASPKPRLATATATTIAEPTNTVAPAVPTDTNVAATATSEPPTISPTVPVTNTPSSTPSPTNAPTNTIAPSATNTQQPPTPSTFPTLDAVGIAATEQTSTAIAAVSITPTIDTGSVIASAQQQPDDMKVAQRVGIFLGILVALLGLILWTRRRMAQIPPAEGGLQQPKITYKIKTKQARQDQADTDSETDNER